MVQGSYSSKVIFRSWYHLHFFLFCNGFNFLLLLGLLDDFIYLYNVQLVVIWGSFTYLSPIFPFDFKLTNYSAHVETFRVLMLFSLPCDITEICDISLKANIFGMQKDGVEQHLLVLRSL